MVEVERDNHRLNEARKRNGCWRPLERCFPLIASLAPVFAVLAFQEAMAATYQGQEGVWLATGGICSLTQYDGQLNVIDTQNAVWSGGIFEDPERAVDKYCAFYATEAACHTDGTSGHPPGTIISPMYLLGKAGYNYTCNAQTAGGTGFKEVTVLPIIAFVPFELNKCETKVADPIDVSSGSNTRTERDLGPIGPGRIEFTRYYSSLPFYVNYFNSGLALSAFGSWTHSYSRRVVPADPDGNLAIVVRPDGAVYLFTKASGVWKPYNNNPANDFHLADGTPDGYVLRTSQDDLEYYSEDGKLLRQLDRFGAGTELQYNADGSLASVRSVFGSTLIFGYQNFLGESKQLVSVTTSDGRQWKYAYPSGISRAPNLEYVIYPDETPADDTDNPRKKYSYERSDFPFALTGVTDEKGVVYATWSYDDQGRAYHNELAGGVAPHTLTFGGNSATSVMDGLNAVRVYNFRSINGLIRATGVSQPGGSGCAASSSAVTYDNNGNVATRTDFNGNVTTYAYDLFRNLETQRVEASGKAEARTISTQWHGYWRLPVKEAEAKKLTTRVYNGDTYQGSVVTCAPATATVPSIGGGTQPIGVLCKKIEQASTDANGSQGFNAPATGTARIWSYTYNQYGQMLTADGPRTDVSDVTTYTYYDIADPDLGKRGNLATITDALGHVTQITAYDGNGNPLTLVDANGVSTTLAYDARQRLTSRTVGGETTTYAYDAVGQLVKVTLPDASTMSYTYDGAHRLTGMADAQGNSIAYTLDAMGNRVKEDVRDPAGQLARARSRVFDALNRLAQDLGAQGQTTLYEYDANGNRTKVTDPLKQVTVSAYDALNRLIAVTDPGQGVTRYGWDGQDRLAQVTDPRKLVTAYTVDGLGNQTWLASPDTGSSASTYDAAGNEVSRTDAKGQKTTIAYDALNRPTRISLQDGSYAAYTWDLGTYGIGRLGKVEEYTSGGQLVGRIGYTHDAQGRVTSETRTVGTVSHTVGYAYAGGQLASLTYPSGRQLSYTRNAAGQVTQISLTGWGQTKVLAKAIAYAPFGRIQSYEDGAGQTHNRGFDADGRIASYSLGGASWLVSYDAASRVSGQVDGTKATNSGIYAYDVLDRLTNATLPTTNYGYTYDADGNRTSQTLGAVTRAYTIDTTSNRMTKLDATPYNYDANGSLVGDGVNQYGYDARGRLAQANTAAGTTQYQVNALGQRVRKAGAGNDTIYHYDGAGHLIAESDAAGTIKREYVWLDDTPLAVLQ